MSEADAEHVRRTQEAWIRNERDAAMTGWSEDATVSPPKEWPEVASRKGRDQIRTVFDDFDEALGPEWPTQLTIERAEDLGGGRVLLEYGWNPSGASSGVPLFQEIAGIYTVTDGKISHADFFISREEGRRAAGAGG
ncbi:MAG: nuclear transport factor 2 family protein [Solirubrobacterales bacterium]